MNWKKTKQNEGITGGTVATKYQNTSRVSAEKLYLIHGSITDANSTLMVIMMINFNVIVLYGYLECRIDLKVGLLMDIDELWGTSMKSFWPSDN